MFGKPAESSPSTDGGRSGQGGGHEQPREFVEALAIERHVKDDGRALLLYTRIEREPA